MRQVIWQTVASDSSFSGSLRVLGWVGTDISHAAYLEPGCP
ncbi:hypothetical protein QUB60_02695 [Microcoleus sp. A2-C5]